MGPRRVSDIISRGYPAEQTTAANKKEKMRSIQNGSFGRILKSNKQAHLGTIWFLAPKWLAAVYPKRISPTYADSSFLEDIIQAQSCLFLAFRMHDDLFDQHEGCLGLIWYGDELLFESQRLLVRHFSSESRFWDFYHRSVIKAIRTVQRINRFQADSHAVFSQSHRYYSELNEVFKIATYAFCLRNRRMKDFQQLSVCLDFLAIVEQMLDDFEDIIDDFNHGRFNSVARFILNAGGSRHKKPLDRMAHNLLYTDVSTRLFFQWDRYLVKAQKSIECLKLPALEEYLISYRDSVRRMGERVHEQRVRQLFNVVGPSKRKTGKVATKSA
jgi:hypothetical protein